MLTIYAMLSPYGGVHADRIREITGWFRPWGIEAYTSSDGVFAKSKAGYNPSSSNENKGTQFTFTASRVVPTGAYIAPRAFGSLVCTYLGA